MIYQGKALKVESLGDGIFELKFDLEGESINKFNEITLTELHETVRLLQERTDLKGLLISSTKEAFIVGADITMFHGVFDKSDDDIIAMNMEINRTLCALEDLPCPTVVAINGLALGGGFELCLSADYRVMAEDAKVGLPEVKLGIFPGWGGTVRLPRMIGADNAFEWICAGKEVKAKDALFEGAVDVVVPLENVRQAALDLLDQCQQKRSDGVTNKLDYLAKRAEKQQPLKLGQLDNLMVFETAKGFVSGKAGPHYPAPVAAIKTIQKHAGLKRDQALEVEAKGFVKVAKTDVCRNLVGLFLSDQRIKKAAAAHAPMASKVDQAAVLGAGIMGGGIAYQSASRNTPILMKDITEKALQLGLDEASKLLTKRVDQGRMTSAKMAAVLGGIRATQSYGDFGNVDIVVEAVVENPKIKASVLAEVEQEVSEETVLTSNTSTISISHLAQGLKRPENFCGMHFFNPVHKMPLVEVIRGEKTGDRAIATTVAYAQAMGKTPIVVNDCPGFLVNRVLFPYFAGFGKLLEDGVDFQRIDKVMEKFGWPMGPAYLLDVVGMDTAVHAQKVMAAGYPDRMASEGKGAIDVMVEADRLGQKNARGFYNYELDRKGKPRKKAAPEVAALIAPLVKQTLELTDEQIIERMMMPLCIETVRCLEENIVSSAAEADMGLIYGIGFPPFRGGALRYIDDTGVAAFCQKADAYVELGGLYHPTSGMKTMVVENTRFYD
ncbi:fatty acid oxidation complex subunit alpha FadB [Motiliproteus sp. MSK22-1]|uniref:fatty acid oxidation complex subunit alpha FadB n=1 Tax=Motiliproteus sp. MSK22-1 TaxID=1897630 RepID=UPI000975EB4B|nr:fatty acid oxidation complex subunit alpha FadB [Motiliproteus sp. MSK22-1]OMH28360.1 multifunctional fatty acid oxidation complex subunit alpha [Motiliproteus sp. MSK22-1]